MNRLYFGDCLHVLKKLCVQNPDGFIDLVYIDPPFNSNRNYNVLFEDIDLTDVKAQKEAFSDTWSSVSYSDTLEEIRKLDLDLFSYLQSLDNLNNSVSKSVVSYLSTMAIRLYYIHKILKETGSFYLHCDPTMSHYLKIVCDLIFKKENFRNEIVWCYTRPGTKHQRQFSRVHDIILYYSKSDKWVFNTDDIRIPYSASTIERGKYSIETSKVTKGIKERVLPKGGKVPEDWWQMPMIQGNSNERLGYPTQKPEALLERIIHASSNKGDIVADFFGGCGTTVAVANRLKRKWICVDISHLAIKLVLERITKNLDKKSIDKLLHVIEINGFPEDIASAKNLAEGTDKHRASFQDWIVEFMLGGVANPKKTGDGGYDGYMWFNKAHDGGKGLAIIEVKSGGVTIAQVRAFMNVVNKRKADIGVFVCFKEHITHGMLNEANHEGKLENFNIDKIQIISVEDLLDNVNIKLPWNVDKTHFKQAKKSTNYKNDNEQELFI